MQESVDFLATQNIVPIDWPPYSPDLSPIEHLWDELDRRIRNRRNPPNTIPQLANALVQEWNNIPIRTVNALMNATQRRIRDAIAVRGGHTILGQGFKTAAISTWIHVGYYQS